MNLGPTLCSDTAVPINGLTEVQCDVNTLEGDCMSPTFFDEADAKSCDQPESFAECAALEAYRFIVLFCYSRARNVGYDRTF